MPFLSEEEVRALRLATAEDISIPGLTKKLKLVKVTGAKSVEIIDASGKQKAGSMSREVFLLLFTSAVAHDTGAMISKEEAEQLFEVVPAEESFTLIAKVMSSLQKKMGATEALVKNSEGSPAAGASSGSAKP